MAIRRELRKYYGTDWHAYRRILIKLAEGKCLKCGREHHMLNGAHINHDPRDMALVMVLCPSCHARHDAKHRLAMMRRNRAKLVGQLWLLPEIEWAPFANWMIPRKVIAGAQETLF